MIAVNNSHDTATNRTQYIHQTSMKDSLFKKLIVLKPAEGFVSISLRRSHSLVTQLCFSSYMESKEVDALQI